MYAKGIKRESIVQAADELDFALDVHTRGNRQMFTVRVRSDKFRKLAPMTMRRTAGVCFHGHYALFKRMFEIEGNPDAEISSSRYGAITYTEATLRPLAQEYGCTPLGHPGNIYHDWQIRDCCNCADTDNNPEGIY